MIHELDKTGGVSGCPTLDRVSPNYWWVVGIVSRGLQKHVPHTDLYGGTGNLAASRFQIRGQRHAAGPINDAVELASGTTLTGQDGSRGWAAGSLLIPYIGKIAGVSVKVTLALSSDTAHTLTNRDIR